MQVPPRSSQEPRANRWVRRIPRLSRTPEESMRRALPSLVALVIAAAPLRAQGWIEIERPRVPLPSNPNIVRVSSEVRTTIDGRVARVEVEERFRNTGGGLAEGSYLYPLPGEAVFQNFSLWMGEQEL